VDYQYPGCQGEVGLLSATSEQVAPEVRPLQDAEEKVNKRFGKSVSKTDDAESLGSHDLPEKDLSPREREVVALLAEGNSNKQIAASLNLSARTVEAYRANVMRKLHLRSFPELVRYAVRNGVVNPQVSGKSSSRNVDRGAPGAPLATERSGASLYAALRMSDEFKDLQASFQAIQKRFAKAKTSKERQKLLASSQEIVLKAHLLIAKFREKAPAKDS
jgi:DNA-binding CsgD family transcriptional regulator